MRKIIFLLALFIQIRAFSQSGIPRPGSPSEDSIAIKRIPFKVGYLDSSTCCDINKVQIRIFDYDSKKQFTGGVVKVNGVSMDISRSDAEAYVLLGKQDYDISARTILYFPSRIHKVSIDPKCTYVIEFYLRPTHEPMH